MALCTPVSHSLPLSTTSDEEQGEGWVSQLSSHIYQNTIIIVVDSVILSCLDVFDILALPAPVADEVATPDPQATPDLQDVAPTLVVPVLLVIVEGIYPSTLSLFTLLN